MKHDLGTVISNPSVRKSIYGAYVIVLVLAGAIQAALVSINHPQPDWLTATFAALVFLGIPVGGLAAANISTTPVKESE